jgi:hypothetical protein
MAWGSELALVSELAWALELELESVLELELESVWVLSPALQIRGVYLTGVASVQESEGA